MKMQILQRGSVAPVVYHLCPLMTYSPPSLTIDACTLVASLDATAGSVIAKHERISPSSSGVSQRACCSGVPYSMSVSMLPVSGALQLKHSGPRSERPMISHSGAYSKLLRPPSWCLAGTNRFHRPAARALGFSSSTTG